jgi:hypothetical protein
MPIFRGRPHRPAHRRRRTGGTFTGLLRALAFLAAATLIPALGWTIGTVAEEVAYRAGGEQAAAEYPVGDPTRCHVRALNDATALVPDLGIDWRWAELDSKKAVGTAILRARIVLIDPEIDCADVAQVAFHEWTHIAVARQLGDAAQPPTGTVTSDLVDDKTGKPFVVDRHEIVADCASLLLLDEYGYPPAWHVYAGMVGGCSPDLLTSAAEVIERAGVKLTDGTATALGSVGAGVA